MFLFLEIFDNLFLSIYMVIIKAERLRYIVHFGHLVAYEVEHDAEKDHYERQNDYGDAENLVFLS